MKNVGAGIQQVFSLFASSDVSLTDAIGIVMKDIILIISTIVVTFYLILEKDGVERDIVFADELNILGFRIEPKIFPFL